jgi:alkylation response protein AidB-like acyl-CoA dehydrogenase
MAERAVDMVIPGIKSKTSMALSRSYAYHAEYQHLLADILIELESIGPHLGSVAEDWSNGVDHGGLWPRKILAAKFHAVEGAWKIVDGAFELGGGFSIFRASGMERMLRDARLGRIHPTNAMLTREFIAKTSLGINPDETPRWG